ncbi:hypothetical protein Dsin_020525 [Dipteronia sinensis]|uniref:PGG domain-containing protein n=1 Tax=Dipteronia sinensis TaxID=43782 RepID=A0AAE0AA60_9ROSI|nr:hypothetical protein Dsin_020525 [Dipteronia sinensis]
MTDNNNNNNGTVASNSNNQVNNLELLDFRAVSSEREMTDNNNNKNNGTVASNSNNQEENFELLDSVYSAAADGDIDKFQQHGRVLDQILTPNGNTILHIHITARRRQSRSRISQNMNFVRKILGKCPELLRKANKKGETLLHMAARHGHADVAEYLLQECKKPYQNDQELAIKATRQMLQMINEAKDTALHEAVRYNHLDVVKVLTVEDRELPYDANNAGETPLFLAAERGYVEVLKEILSTCISPVDHGPNSRTALHATVLRNDKGTTTLLLNDKRILKSEQDQEGWTPLHLAALLGYIVILKKLLNKDRSAAYKADNEGKTALHVAAGLGRVDIMQELISKCPGCCELVDNRGWNVLHFASTIKNRRAVGLILQNPLLGNLAHEKDKKGNTPFLHAASMRFIINHPKVDVQVFNNDNHNARDMVGPLSFSSWNSKLDCILWFIWTIWRVNRNGRLIMSKDDHKEGKENRGDPVSSNSNSNDDGVGKNGLVAATLIATVTFAAGFTVPGGFVADEGPDQGAAILTKNRAFQAFVILNTMAMILSTLAVIEHLSLRPPAHNIEIRRQKDFRILLIGYAMQAMIGAFLAGTCAVLNNNKILAIGACVLPVAMCKFIAIMSFRKPDLRYLRNTGDKL